MKILEPNPPPTSGAITRSLCSGAIADEGGEDEAGYMRVLARRVERVVVGPEIVLADGRAGLDGRSAPAGC